MSRSLAAHLLAVSLLTLMGPAMPAGAAILWSDPGPVRVQNNGDGADILHGAVKRNNDSSGVLYFEFHVNPLSDVSSEPYTAGFELFEGNHPMLGIGNSLKEWGYGAFNTDETGKNNAVPGDFDLNSANPETYSPPNYLPYELPRRGIERTIVFRVQYVPGGPDLVTVWLNPNLRPGATEDNQLTNLTTHFTARCSFDQIRLLHQGQGDGWIFSDMAIATSFDDFIVTPFWRTWWFATLMAMGLLVWVGTTVRFVERRRFQHQLQHAEQQHALERERARIAQDLHDDLGSSLTRLSLLSGLVKTDRDNPEQVEVHADKMSQAAIQTVRALEEIVWAVRPGSDTLQSLVDYIAHFANELFEGNSTHCRLDLPHDLPARSLLPDMRHNIFLIVKEALTNAMKHADATEVHVQAKVSGDRLEILVWDNGKGFDAASLAEGQRNGMGNMRRRAETIDGKLELQSVPTQGTAVRLSVNLQNQNSTGRT